MAGNYIWARNQSIARNKIMKIKSKYSKITLINRAPALDKKNYGKAYYYILDKIKTGDPTKKETMDLVKRIKNSKLPYAKKQLLLRGLK